MLKTLIVITYIEVRVGKAMSTFRAIDKQSCLAQYSYIRLFLPLLVAADRKEFS